MSRKNNCWLFEQDLVHNYICNKLYQSSDNRKCRHWPTFTVSASVRKLSSCETSLFACNQKDFDFIAQEILKSDDICHIYHELCLDVEASLSNGDLLALLAENLIKQHSISKIEAIIKRLQKAMKEKPHCSIIPSVSSISALLFTCLSIYIGIYFQR